MENKEFYEALTELPKSYFDSVRQSPLINKALTGEISRGQHKGKLLNPITAVAWKSTGTVYGTGKRDTLAAAKALGLSRVFTAHIYNAITCVSNRGNTQVVRGKIRSALGV